MNNTQLLIAIGWPTLAILVGVLINNRQIDMLSRHIDQQIISLRNELKSELLRVEGVLDARLSQVEQILKIR
jgi:hypothetical protein